MVLEGVVKYIIATIILVLSLALGWFISAKYLDSLILKVLKVFNPETHEKYLDIWFIMFAIIELIVVFGYLVYVYKIYNGNKRLTKSSSGR
jgi:hypothetical protein